MRIAEEEKLGKERAREQPKRGEKLEIEEL